MSKNKFIALTVATVFAIAPLTSNANAKLAAPLAGGAAAGSGISGALAGAAVIGACAVSIFLANLNKGQMQKKQLTEQEALSCGLAYWFR